MNQRIQMVLATVVLIPAVYASHGPHHVQNQQWQANPLQAAQAYNQPAAQSQYPELYRAPGGYNPARQPQPYDDLSRLGSGLYSNLQSQPPAQQPYSVARGVPSATAPEGLQSWQETYPALAQVFERPSSSNQAPARYGSTLPPYAQVNDGKSHYSPVPEELASHVTHKTKAFLPVELGAGYFMGVLMSDELIGILKKLGLTKNTDTPSKEAIEKLKRKRAWYVPAAIVLAALTQSLTSPDKAEKFVQCKCVNGCTEITHISRIARIGNVSIGFLLGLIAPHWYNKTDSPSSVEKKSSPQPKS